MSVPVFQFIPTPSLPAGNHKFVFYICNSVSVLYIRSLYIMKFFDLFLHSVSIHLVSVHVAANGVISFFYMAE